jgi:hypothetical protein
MAIRASKSGLGRAQQFDFLFHHFPRFSQQPNGKKRKKIELETNIETETKKKKKIPRPQSGDPRKSPKPHSTVFFPAALLPAA